MLRTGLGDVPDGDAFVDWVKRQIERAKALGGKDGLFG